LAPTVLSASIVSVHVAAVPVQAPLQVTEHPACGVAVSGTVAFGS